MSWTLTIKDRITEIKGVNNELLNTTDLLYYELSGTLYKKEIQDFILFQTTARTKKKALQEWEAIVQDLTPLNPFIQGYALYEWKNNAILSNQ